MMISYLSPQIYALKVVKHKMQGIFLNVYYMSVRTNSEMSVIKSSTKEIYLSCSLNGI